MPFSVFNVFNCVVFIILLSLADSVTAVWKKAHRNQTCPLHSGIHTFDELVNSGRFIDKSLMLKEFFESKCGITVVTRPRKWGKTVNLEMVQRFFELEVNDIGIHRKVSERRNHLIFKGGEIDLHNCSSKVLNPLQIANFSNVMDNLGVFPVVTFKIDSAKGKNYRVIETNLKKEMKNAYKSHCYLKVYSGKDSDMLNVTEKAQLAKFYSNKQLTIQDLQDGLLNLCKVLFEHFRKRVIVLIDEYDAVMNHAVEHFGENSGDTHKLLVLLQNIFKGIVNNPYIEKCLITGTLPFTEDALFPNTSKLCVNTVLEEKYSDYFGFSDSEVDTVLRKGLLSNFTSVNKMKYWYKGFSHGGKMLYNPLDIMGYMSNNGKILDYWADSGRVRSLDEFLVTDEAQEDLQKLLEDEGTMKSMCKYDKKESKEEEGFHLFFNIFYRLMLNHGYLNAFKQGDTGSNYLLRIPNQEIRNAFVDYKTKWFCTKNDLLPDDLYEFVGSLVTNQLDTLKETLGKVFYNFENSTLKKEKDYHRVMGDLLSRLMNHNMVFSNKHFEVGRLYHMIVPRSQFQGHSAFVLEYKVLEESGVSTPGVRQLQELAQDTLDHIDSNIYGPILAHYKYVDKVATIGVAFYKTDLEIAYKVFKQDR